MHTELKIFEGGGVWKQNNPLEEQPINYLGSIK